MCEPKSKPNRNNGNQEVLVASKSAAPCKDEEVTMDTVRKKVGKSGKDVLAMRTPPPPAVARRNARERNRVKQVNNGFANLRQHIPNSIAAAFESGTGRSGNKKLSKVETLRMAVEYIRSLEKVLGLNEDGASAASPTLSYQSGSLESHPEGSYRISLASPSSEDDSISTTNSATPPLPFVIGTDKFHIVPMHFLQSNALKVESDLTSSSLVEANSHHHHHHHQIEMKAAQLSQDVNTNVSLSPEIYSDGSLSPRTEGDIQNFIPVFNIEELSQDATASVKLKESSKTANEEMRILCRNLIMLQADAEAGKQPLNMNELISW